MKNVNMEEKELLQKLVKESNCLTEILAKQEMKQTQTNIQALKETLDGYGIAHNHLPNKLIQEKKELSEILTENSTYQSAKLRKRLIDEGLKECRCEKCGNTGEWQG
jgi:hypothetical protein